MFGAKKIKRGGGQREGEDPPKPICKQSWRLRGGLPSRRRPPAQRQAEEQFCTYILAATCPTDTPGQWRPRWAPGQCCRRVASSCSPPGGGGRLRTGSPQGPQYFKEPGWARGQHAPARPAFRSRTDGLSSLPAQVASVWQNGDPPSITVSVTKSIEFSCR